MYAANATKFCNILRWHIWLVSISFCLDVVNRLLMNLLLYIARMKKAFVECDEYITISFVFVIEIVSSWKHGKIPQKCSYKFHLYILHFHAEYDIPTHERVTKTQMPWFSKCIYRCVCVFAYMSVCVCMFICAHKHSDLYTCMRIDA